MVAAGIMLCGYYFIKHIFFKKEKITFNIKRDWPLLAQIVIFHIYLTYLCDLCALKDISSGESAFLYNLSPFISALLSYLWFGEVMTRKKWFGLILGFVALIPSLVQDWLSCGLSGILGAKIMTLIAVASSAYGWIILRELVKDRGYSPIFINGFGMTLGGILAFATSYFTESWQPTPVTEWIPFIQATILIVITANLMFYNLYGYLLNRYTATFLSFAGFTCPLYAGILGWLFLGEPLPLNLLPSFALISIGLFIFYQEELRQGYIIRK